MPKKKGLESPEQQAERFKRAVQAMVDAGELNPAEADAAFDRVMSGVANLRRDWFQGGEDQENPP